MQRRDDRYLTGVTGLLAFAAGVVFILGAAYLYINQTGPVMSGPVVASVQQDSATPRP